MKKIFLYTALTVNAILFSASASLAETCETGLDDRYKGRDDYDSYYVTKCLDNDGNPTLTTYYDGNPAEGGEAYGGIGYTYTNDENGRSVIERYYNGDPANNNINETDISTYNKDGIPTSVTFYLGDHNNGIVLMSFSVASWDDGVPQAYSVYISNPKTEAIATDITLDNGRPSEATMYVPDPEGGAYIMSFTGDLNNMTPIGHLDEKEWLDFLNNLNDSSNPTPGNDSEPTPETEQEPTPGTNQEPTPGTNSEPTQEPTSDPNSDPESISSSEPNPEPESEPESEPITAEPTALKAKRTFYTPAEAAAHVNHSNHNKVIFTFK